eukprot:TRINITY_DN12568_c0_g1_i1.p1 TRINITY_DN12568_c0_g1~~TRINITY_DN12568_c0_g1_i1.p1  ORF type:complete len:348 (+),score=77.74 TRINITY_DN12568_c0_g1_i1:56-1045(+)
MTNSLLKQAARHNAGMPPPPPPRPGGGLPRPKKYEPISESTCFEDIRHVDVGSNKFRVYRNSGPDNSPAVVFCVHGAGLCAMSWGLCAKELGNRVPVTTFDMRGHGLTTTDDDSDLSTETLTNDIIQLLGTLYQPGQKVLLVGHSLGGALSIRVAARHSELQVDIIGCVVVDVVEGTALDSLRHMKGILARKPDRFSSMSEAINWGINGVGIKNEESARASMPGQIRQVSENEFVWRTDLFPTEAYWRGWFEGMGEQFLNSPAPKLLLVAGTDRLDKELSIAHMQGRFQLSIVYGTGHYMQEDKPEEIADIITTFYTRFTKPVPTSRGK